MKKCFFIQEIVPLLIIVGLIFIESKIINYFNISFDTYFFLMVIPTGALYFPLVKFFEKKVIPYLLKKNFCN